MSKCWEQMSISKKDYDELSFKLEQTMTRITQTFSRDTHASEDSFFISFMAALSFTLITFGEQYYLEFKSSKTNQNGKNAPEKKYGCDFGLRVNFNAQSVNPFSKAIIGQAKNKPRRDVEGDKDEKKRLGRQCEAMSEVTSNYIVTFRPASDESIPLVYLGDQKNKSYEVEGIRFDKYLLEYVLPCSHGEKDTIVMGYMISSTHSGWSDYVRVFEIDTNLPKPNPTPDSAPEPDPQPRKKPKRSMRGN